MKALKKDLQSIIKTLNLLSAKAEKIAAQLDAMPVTAPPSRTANTRTSAAKKKAQPTASDAVLNIIKRQKKGIDTAGLKTKTDLDTKTIRNVIFRLKKQGKVQATTRGLYMAV